jgi:hypothetical protein
VLHRRKRGKTISSQAWTQLELGHEVEEVAAHEPGRHLVAAGHGLDLLHGGPSPGAPKGNQNAFKHGLYTAEAIANRRQIAALLRTMRALARVAG